MACTNIENEFIQIGSRGKTREKWVEVVREKKMIAKDLTEILELNGPE